MLAAARGDGCWPEVSAAHPRRRAGPGSRRPVNPRPAAHEPPASRRLRRRRLGPAPIAARPPMRQRNAGRKCATEPDIGKSASDPDFATCAESALMCRGRRGRGGERERARRPSRVARQARPAPTFTAECPRAPPRRDPQAGDCAHRAHRHPGPAAQRADGGRSALTRCPAHAKSCVSPSRACGTQAPHSRRPASATSPSSAACRNERRRPHAH